MIYHVDSTTSGWAVRRPNGDYAEFLSRAEADEACEALNAADTDESDYDWQESR